MSTLLERLQHDYTAKLKQRDARAVSVLRMVRTHCNNEAIAKRAPLTDAEVLRILQRDVKRHEESIAAFRTAGRAEQAATEEAELAILRTYLPVPLTADELTQIVRTAVTDVGATGPADFGRVMKTVMERANGRADGTLVQQAVRQALQQAHPPA